MAKGKQLPTQERDLKDGSTSWQELGKTGSFIQAFVSHLFFHLRACVCTCMHTHAYVPAYLLGDMTDFW